MVRSMSGHGRGEATNGDVRVVAELRSVNHRFCRIALRLPGELARFEDDVRRRIQERVQRGKVDLQVTVEAAGSVAARLDRTAAKEWADEVRALAQETGVSPELRVGELLSLPGVLVPEGLRQPDPGSDGATLRAALEQALDGLEQMRCREGEHLAGDLRARVRALEQGVERIAEQAADMPSRVKEQLQERLAELLADRAHAPDEERIVQEAAYYAERADITEELVRLRSHLHKLEELLASGEAVGRTLEFVAQEVHRELTTIGSKAKDLQIADEVLELKAELERVREQVQNIE